jgi:hypothetical protein
MMAMFRVVALGITIHHNKGDFEIGRILRGEGGSPLSSALDLTSA